ncbi:MAG TPA: heavy metal translocating P-type ATPase [Acidimicrobiales bacterium]|nr:heavy metal translocating P-type ATPase [Acidimicrobiales bacterium]
MPLGRVDLVVSGMTCASCSARVEKTLNKLTGAVATVNLATERASISYDPALLSPHEMIKAVNALGYQAVLAAQAGAGQLHLRPEAQAEPRPGQGPGRQPPRLSSSYRARLIVAATASVPVALLQWAPASRFPGWQVTCLVLSTLAVGYAGWPFHRAAAVNARHGVATMDTLVSLGTTAAWTWSVVVLAFGLHQDLHFDVATIVTALVLVGRDLESRAKRRAGQAMAALFEIGAKEAQVLVNGQEVATPVENLEIGDLFVVRPGEKVATDGIVEGGLSAVDNSLLTGEALPIEVTLGDEVTGGSLNLSGRLVVRATRVGAGTVLAEIGRMVNDAQAGRAPAQRLADRVSAVFVPVVITVALVTFTGWLVIGGTGPGRAFIAAVAVVVVACPCALGLATPVALMVGTGRGAQLGILLKGPEVLELAQKVTTVVFDKTGTLTQARMTVETVVPVDAIPEDEVLRMAAAAEQGSEHPLGRAITEHAVRRLGPPAPARGFLARPGLGVEAFVSGGTALVGRPALLAGEGIPFPPAISSKAQALEEKGRSVVAVAFGPRLLGLLALSDPVKPTARQAITELRSLGLEPVLLSGDNVRAALSVAAGIGIEKVVAGALPDEKATEVRRLQADGKVVAFVGDGVNDAPALAQADLGIAIGTGTDLAIEASDLTLVSGDPRAVTDAVRLSRRVLATIRANLFWAFAYNVVAIPLAVAGIVSPIIAAAAMASSSLVVVSNSLRLRRFKPVAASS